MNVTSPAGETHTSLYLCVLANQQHQSNTFLAATSGQPGHHLKPSNLRRRAEVIHASNEPDSSNGNHERSIHDSREEDLVRQEQLGRMPVTENGAPPPYADGE